MFQGIACTHIKFNFFFKCYSPWRVLKTEGLSGTETEKQNTLLWIWKTGFWFSLFFFLLLSDWTCMLTEKISALNFRIQSSFLISRLNIWLHWFDFSSSLVCILFLSLVFKQCFLVCLFLLRFAKWLWWTNYTESLI